MMETKISMDHGTDYMPIIGHLKSCSFPCSCASVCCNIIIYQVFLFLVPFLGKILGGVFGGLFLCSLLLVFSSLACVIVACIRVKKKRQRRLVQRNVVEESLPHRSGQYNSYSAMYPPVQSSVPPPYCDVDPHPSVQPGTFSQAASSTSTVQPIDVSQPLHPVTNFSSNSMISHETRPSTPPPLYPVQEPGPNPQPHNIVPVAADVVVGSPAQPITMPFHVGVCVQNFPLPSAEQSATSCSSVISPGFSLTSQADEDHGHFLEGRNTEEEPLIS